MKIFNSAQKHEQQEFDSSNQEIFYILQFCLLFLSTSNYLKYVGTQYRVDTKS